MLGQLTNINVQNGSYPYGTAENVTYNYRTGANKGKVSSTYNAVSGETVTSTYDSLNRLLTASGSGWGQQYGFDPFGNLTSKTVTSGSGPSLSVSVNPANNQIQGVYGLGYDAHGNATGIYNSGVPDTFTHDAENRLSEVSEYGVQLTSVYYGYDAQNRRIFNWPGTLDAFGTRPNT